MAYKNPLDKKKWHKKNRDRLNKLERESYHRRKNLGTLIKRDPKKVKNTDLKRNYGITLAEYNKRVEKQEGKCLICGRLDSNLFVDHDHTSNIVRGLLCKMCNLMLGFSGDNIEILLNAVNYLKGH